MLTAIRERSSGWIAWVIVIILVIPFALWGISSYFEGGGELSVATVNGEDISAYTYQNDLSLQTQNLSERLGGNFDPTLLDTLGIRQRVLDNLINNQLLNQFVNDNNFRISDDQLSLLIQNESAFHVDGKFDLAQYQTILNANRFTPQGFEAYQRVNETVTQIRLGISDTAFSTAYDKNRLLSYQDQTRTAAYTIISAAQISTDEEVTEDQIKDYYERNIERYSNDARLRVDYIELSIDALKKSILPTDEDIIALYEETKGRYRKAESRRASHILLASSSSAGEEERAEKLKLTNELIARVNEGEDFASLAKEFSDDPGSSNNGGDLGVVARDQMVKPFEDAVFSMASGETRGPIETQFGYHIIQLTELQEGEQQTLEEVRQTVSEESATIQAETLFSDLAESFKNLVFEDPENLTTAADELDLPILSSDWFTVRNGDGVAKEAAVRNAAFSEDVLTDNLISPAISIGFDKLIAVKKLEYETVTEKLLEEVRGEIEQSIRNELIQSKILELGSSYLSEIDESAKTRSDWASYIAGKGLVIEQYAGKKQDIPAELALLGNSVFASTPPESDRVETGGVALANGDYVLFALENRVLADPTSVEEGVSSNIQERLESRDGEEMFLQFRELLKEKAEVVTYEDQL